MFYFRDSVVEQIEEVHCRDVLDAIDRAQGKPAHLRVEVWSEDRRVADIGKSPGHLSVAPAKRRAPRFGVGPFHPLNSEILRRS